MELVNKLNSVNCKKEQLTKLSDKYKLSEDVVKLLFSRGLQTDKDFENYLNPSINNFYNPFGLSGMQELVNRINKAIKNNEKTLIVGDYDTDGICATTVLLKYFETRNYKVDYFLPNRFSDGYSLTMDTVDKIKKLYNPTFIITVDCGISCEKEIEYAKTLGMEIAVTDHHEIPEVIPNTIVVDPKLSYNKYPFRELCGAGVALKVVQALGGLNEAIKYSNIAALATVADIVPLISENRAIVAIGLQHQSELPFGVKKLIKACQITNLTSTDIAFKLAPKINTAGRLKDANLALQLFINNNEKELNNSLKELLDLNEKRIEKCNTISDEAFRMLDKVNVSKKHIIVLYNENWDSGVLGIVCSKIVEKINKPVCLLGKCKDEFKGSLRSVENVDIFKSLTYCKDLLIRFGGHSQAGGISIYKNNISSFENKMEEYISKNYSDEFFIPKKYYDFDFSDKEINFNYLKEIKLLEPFGFGNEKPIIKLNLNNAKVSRMKNHYNHLKVNSNGIEIIGFNLGAHYEQINSNCQTEILIDVNEETYAGKTRIKGFIKNIKCYQSLGSCKKDMACASELSFNNCNKINNKITNINLVNYIKNNKKLFSNLFITTNFNNYTYAIKNAKNYILNYEIYSILDGTGINTILYVPLINYCDLKNLKNYTNIIFLDDFLNINIQPFLGKKLYVANLENTSNLPLIDGSRQSIINVYNVVKKLCNYDTNSIFNYFAVLQKNSPIKIKFYNFVYALIVLEQLNIITIENKETFVIKTTNKKSNLENSEFFKYINSINKK